MQVIPITLVAALAAALVAPVFQEAPAQGPSSIPGISDTLTAAAWTPDYKPFRMTVTGGQSSYMGMDLSTLIMMGQFGESNGPPTILLDATCRWTKGDKTTLNGVTYLVAYKAEFPGLVVTARSPSLKGRSVFLELDLIRADAITEIQPALGLTKESFLKDTLAAGLSFVDYPSPEMLAVENKGDDQAKTLSNIKQLALGTIIYQNDYDDVLPLAQSTAQVDPEIQPYIKSEEVWKTLNPNGGRILFNTNLSAVNSTVIAEPARTPMFFEQNAWPDGRRAVAYADGHAKLEDQATWESLQPLLHMKFPRTPPPTPPKRKVRGK